LRKTKLFSTNTKLTETILLCGLELQKTTAAAIT